jgi:preprotein translocase subunit SecE
LTVKELIVAKRNKGGGIQRFYRETAAELRKVTWPTREEAWNLTKVTVVVIIAMGAFLGVLDLLFGRLFAFILTL